MSELDNKLHRVCFTGHRPEKLRRDAEHIKSDLEREIRQASADGAKVYISGMARGVDIWAAQIVLKLRDEGEAVKLVCACPYDGFERSWSREWAEQYRDVLCRADRVAYISDRYNSACFRRRNEWMVDHASIVIAVFNGERSGTKNTVDYAAKVSVPVVLIDG